MADIARFKQMLRTQPKFSQRWHLIAAAILGPENKSVIRIAIRTALIAALLALAACGTTKAADRRPGARATRRPLRSGGHPDGDHQVDARRAGRRFDRQRASATSEKNRALEAEYRALEYTAGRPGRLPGRATIPATYGQAVGRPALSRRLAGLPAIHADGRPGWPVEDRARHRVPQQRRKLDAADLTMRAARRPAGRQLAACQAVGRAAGQGY